MQRTQEEASSIFCNELRSFCRHLQSMCNNLKTSMNQRPIPLDASVNPFVELLNRRATLTNEQVEAVESMTRETVSFRELLGHCNELYKQNEIAIAVLEDRLKEYGYESAEIGSSDESWPLEGSSPRADKVSALEAIFNCSLSFQTAAQPPDYKTSTSATTYLPFTVPSTYSTQDCSSNVLPDDRMFNDSLTLQDLGLSDACLATLAREANAGHCSPLAIQKSQDSKDEDKKLPCGYPNDPDVLLNSNYPTISYQSTSEDLEQTGANREGPVVDSLLHVSKEDYDKTPSWLRGLASWEELEDAISKISSLLSERAKQVDGKGAELLDQDDMEPLGFGPKAKVFLLLLVRMNCLTIEHHAGATVYKVNSK